jgi:hypothetical protein
MAETEAGFLMVGLLLKVVSQFPAPDALEVRLPAED